MTTDFTDLLIRTARAIDSARSAGEYAESCDEGHIPPETAARFAWDASAILRAVGEKFTDIADQHMFAARRFERAQREENRSGVEHRGGEAA